MTEGGNTVENLTSYVNIKQGTASDSRFSVGNTLPLVAAPFGMNHFCLQTKGSDDRWFYHPAHRQCEGIRLTHQPSPWMADWGHFVLMPQSGKPYASEGSRASGFRENVSSPSLLEMEFRRYHARLRLAPTERCAILDVTWDTDETPRFCFFPFSYMTEMRLDTEKNILYGKTNAKGDGTRQDFQTYFELHFDQPIDESQTVLTKPDGTVMPGTSGADDGLGISIAFRMKRGDTLTARLGVSFLSPAFASLAIDRELGERSLDEIRMETEQKWNALLNTIEISGDETRKRTFYSCLYRCFLFPRVFYELDEKGEPYHYCTGTGEQKPGVMYTDNGFWDTYRTTFPLFSLLIPERMQEMIAGFLNFYQEEGWLPKWVSPGERGIMPGTLIDAVLADAAMKGLLTQEQMEIALEGMLKNANVPSGDHLHGRVGVADYLRLGYVPSDLYRESVNNALDGYSCDFCIAQVAEILGKQSLAEEYRKRSTNYRLLFDPQVGFIRGRKADGSREKHFSPIAWGGEYCEGGAWQNAFSVYHDPEGLATLYGGREKLIEKLDALFSAPPDFEIGTYPCEIHEMTEMNAANFGQCAISNQPSFHLPFLFSALGNREKTAYWAGRIRDEAFSPDVYPGDEDNGSMAAWYVFSCLGLYPLCPGKDEYVLSDSLPGGITLHLGNGNKLQIIHPNETAAGLVYFNGVPLTNHRISHSQLMAGGILSF